MTLVFHRFGVAEKRVKGGSVAQFVGNFGLIFALRKFFYGFLVEWRCCGRKSLVFDRMGARAKARRLAPLLV